MSTTPPLYNSESAAGDYIDLTQLATELQRTPEGLYLFHNYVSFKYGASTTKKGSKLQVNRLKPLASPNPDNLAAYKEGGSRMATPTEDPDDLQSLNWDKVTIKVERYRMPKPVAEKFETEQLSQVDIMAGHRINLRQNYNEFLDDLIREEYRSKVCTNIFGGQIRASITAIQNNPSTDGLNVAMLKEFKRRAAALHLRAHGYIPNSDNQALSGQFLAITDQVGVNELTEDELWRDYVIRAGDTERSKIVKGWVGEIEQVLVVKSDRMRTVDVGPTGAPYLGHEILFTASDPVLLESAQNGQPNYMGENPVVLAMVGEPQVRQDKNDNFGEDLIYTWFHTLGIKALESLTNADATAITSLLGGSDTSKGVAAVGSSRFIHRGYFV